MNRREREEERIQQSYEDGYLSRAEMNEELRYLERDCRASAASPPECAHSWYPSNTTMGGYICALCGAFRSHF